MTADVTNRPARWHAYNARKRQALKIFNGRGWLNPAEWAVLAGFFPIRSAYTYLARLWRWDLLERRYNAQGLVVYRISQRGLQRLVWLVSRT